MRYLIGFAALALAVVGPSARADDKAKGQDTIDPKVVDIVKKAGALYKDAKSIHCDVALEITVDGENQKQQRKPTGTYDIERPNRLSLRRHGADGDKGDLHFVADGKKLFVLRPDIKQYTTDEAPDSLADIGQNLLRIRPTSGMLFQNVLAEDPADALMDGVNSCSYAGEEKVGDTPAHHMKFVQDQFSWEMWVAKEGKPLVLKMKNIRENDNGKVVAVETYSNYKIDAPIAKDVFAFTPPKDAKKVDEFPESSERQ